ncbi:hypothetical protein FRC12_006599 [Ceratobasidium sp. 428]|nr:hypothetical protein FRC12_006599 [Ceratobasidium sp. 428]
MRSTNFVAFFLLVLFSVLKVIFAEPTPADELVERGSNLDVASHPGHGLQSSLGGGSGLSKSKSDKCQTGWGSCPNDPGSCCQINGRCCGNRKCCQPGKWCYASGCCPTFMNGCNNKTCIPKGMNCCKGGSYCQPGQRCIKNGFGEIRCCPSGRLCLFKDGRPATNANA